MVFYKKHCNALILDYEDFVEEALCFGWIDSTIKKLDEDRYARKVAPRRPNSVWSEHKRTPNPGTNHASGTRENIRF
ncbi:MAG: hypothetical protein Q7J65_00055 [Candidatus Marinimicrobia bacterium]|nr:hypothetical protein [Candidatus Neomarinimicrobiota bacterium]